MKSFWTSAVLLTGLMVVIGCGNKADTNPTDKKDDKTTKATDDKKVEPAGGGHDWWCDEHGVKEAECSMCNSKVAKAFQDKGDWCKEHSRAKSQCFICDPKLKDKFAAEYKAKFGKEPPEAEGQMEEKKEDKKDKK
jgi:hypothetical protein